MKSYKNRTFCLQTVYKLLTKRLRTMWYSMSVEVLVEGKTEAYNISSLRVAKSGGSFLLRQTNLKISIVKLYFSCTLCKYVEFFYALAYTITKELV